MAFLLSSSFSQGQNVHKSFFPKHFVPHYWSSNHRGHPGGPRNRIIRGINALFAWEP